MESVRELGCDVAQGFLFAHPVPADEMTTMLAERDRRADLPRRRLSA
jgi:EAL domain-containing protein (putative c-di-GMP-specific phosphodiesterase class I)